MRRSQTGKGPGGTWKTGQRVPESGFYRDQYKVSSFHEAGRTFPPCLDRKGECAFREFVKQTIALG